LGEKPHAMYARISKSKFKTPVDKIKDMLNGRTQESVTQELGIDQALISRAINQGRVSRDLGEKLGFRLVKREPVWEPIRT
jgi:hypothetical protein